MSDPAPSPNAKKPAASNQPPPVELYIVLPGSTMALLIHRDSEKIFDEALANAVRTTTGIFAFEEMTGTRYRLVGTHICAWTFRTPPPRVTAPPTLTEQFMQTQLLLAQEQIKELRRGEGWKGG